MSTFLQDIRYALRLLAKSPGFTAIAVASLALGIGANTAVFSVVNAVLLKALPFHEPESIVLTWGDSPKEGTHRGQISATDLADWQSRNHSFEAISTYASFRPVLAGKGEPERISGAQVGDGFFSVMRGRPLFGRVFTAEEQEDGKDYVVVLGYGLWQRRFGGDPNVVGQTLSLSGRPYTIIGVMPADFQSLPAGLLDAPAEFYRPVAELPDEKERASRHLRGIARLKSGVTLEQAQTEMNLIARQLDQAVFNIATMDQVLSDSTSLRRFSMVLLGLFAGLALLLAAIGIYGVLAQSVAQRTHEIGIRMALGAQTRDVLRLVVGHGMALTLGGVVIGIAGALGLTRLLATLLFGVGANDPTTFVLIPLLLLIVSFLASYWPAHRAAKLDPINALARN